MKTRYFLKLTKDDTARRCQCMRTEAKLDKFQGV